MNAIIDTSVLAGGPLELSDLPEDSAISVITLAELRLGVLLASDPATRHARTRTLDLVQSIYQSIPVNDLVAGVYASLVAEARRLGRRPGRFDALIAATAITQDVPVVTRDAGFQSFPGLDVVLLA